MNYDMVPCNAMLSRGFLSINLEKMNCCHSSVSQLSTSQELC